MALSSRIVECRLAHNVSYVPGDTTPCVFELVRLQLAQHNIKDSIILYVRRVGFFVQRQKMLRTMRFKRPAQPNAGYAAASFLQRNTRMNLRPTDSYSLHRYII